MIKQISVFLENKTGRLIRMAQALDEAGINIRGLSNADTSDFGILRMSVDQPDKAITVLKEKGVMANVTEVIIMTGNEAIALGAYEGGVAVGKAYPGTPSTEILENLALYEGVDCNWSPNEKTVLEVAIGASMEGARVLAAMKHVGVNIAADALSIDPVS